MNQDEKITEIKKILKQRRFAYEKMQSIAEVLGVEFEEMGDE